MTKFGKPEKTGLSGLWYGVSWFWQFHSWIKEEGQTEKFEDSIVFEAWKREIRHQGTKTEEIQAWRRSHKNRVFRFGIPDGPVFSEQIESN
jgi:hypothetical protein